jgi:putative transposase
MRLSRKAEIQPTPKQIKQLLQHTGNARWAYNWGLAKRNEAYAKWVELGKPKKWAGWPNATTLHKELNLLKKEPVENGGVPWMYDASKYAPQEALRDLDTAFNRFLKGLAKYPQFKKKQEGAGSYRLGCPTAVDEKGIKLASIGRVRFQPGEYEYIPKGIYPQVTVSQYNQRWYVSVTLPEQPEVESNGQTSTVGVDLRVASTFMTLSTGEKQESPKALAKGLKKLQRLQQDVSRKVLGSENRKKAIRRLAKAHARVANIRKDAMHKLTTELTQNHACLVVEDLSIQKMVQSEDMPKPKRRRVNFALYDASFYEFRRMLEYKSEVYGCKVIKVNPAYTTQKCSSCGHVEESNRQSNTDFKCQSCGFTFDLAQNAAINILAAASQPEALNACGEVEQP